MMSFNSLDETTVPNIVTTYLYFVIIWHPVHQHRTNCLAVQYLDLSFTENQEIALQDNSSCVELDAYLADCNVMQFWQDDVNKFP